VLRVSRTGIRAYLSSKSARINYGRSSMRGKRLGVVADRPSDALSVTSARRATFLEELDAVHT
jgi:hypothetical protein